MAELVICQKDALVSVADSIRDKAGLTDGLVFPTGFISAINGIGDGSGTGSEWNVVAKSGTYNVADGTGAVIVQHGLGIKPDFILVTGLAINKDGYLNATYNMSTDFKEFAGVEISAMLSRPDTSMTSTGTWDSDSAFMLETNSLPRDVDENTFTVGGNNGLHMGRMYTYIVIARKK